MARDPRLRELATLTRRLRTRTDEARRTELLRELKLEGLSVKELAEASGMSDKLVYRQLGGVGTARVGRGAHKTA